MLLLTLLNENGMTEKDVNIVDMSIQESGNAFIAGQCDADVFGIHTFHKQKKLQVVQNYFHQLTTLI